MKKITKACWTAAGTGLLIPLCAFATWRESIDPELNTPYQLRVVLMISEHRMLTPQFQKQLESVLRDQLQLSLGKLANIEVVRGHERIAEIRTKGLQAVLENWSELSSKQTHFVLIDFTDGKYSIESGFHDGMTGLSGPVIRRYAVGDRQRVGDTAAQMVRKNFGVVGTVKSFKGHDAVLEIKGGGLVDSLSPWIKPGEAFAVVRIAEKRAIPIEWALLEVMEVLNGGAVRCRYTCRYVEDSELDPERSKSVFRCLKLSTIKGPVQLRLVHKVTYEFLDKLRVEVLANPDLKKPTLAFSQSNGLVTVPGIFSDIAYVSVFRGQNKLASFPIPLLDDRAVVCFMSPDPKADALGYIENRRDRWERWCLEELALADQRRSQLQNETRPEEALIQCEIHQKAIATEVIRLDQEKEALSELAKQHNMFLDLSTGKQIGDALAKRQDELARYLSELKKIIQENYSDEARRLKAQYERGRLLEKNAEFDKAIDLYESTLSDPELQKLGASAEVKKRLDQLKTEWIAKNEEHTKARRFLYDTWANLELSKLQANLPEARKNFMTCKALGDRLTPLKLQLVNIQHGTALLKELETVRGRRDSQDNRTKLKAMDQLANELRDLQKEVTAWLTSDKKSPNETVAVWHRLPTTFARGEVLASPRGSWVAPPL